MIIGKGSLAKLLNDRDDVCFHAAGVSDSQMHGTQRDVLETFRENFQIATHVALCNQYNIMFVYFSTISIFLVDTFYTRHKKHVENALRLDCKNYTIIRLGNIWECTNPNTFINAYKRQPYAPRVEWKYMISKEQLNFVTDNLPRTGKHEISIFGEMLTVEDALKR